jgi:hypothetical protein
MYLNKVNVCKAMQGLNETITFLLKNAMNRENVKALRKCNDRYFILFIICIVVINIFIYRSMGF